MKHWANSRALPAMPRLRGTTSQTARGDGDTCSGALCRHASLWNADTELAPRGSRTSGAERRTFSLTATDIFAYSRSSTPPALRYFNSSQFKISWYFDTEMPVQHCGTQKARMPTITSESQVGPKWIQSFNVGSLPVGLNGFARLSISRGVPGTRLKGWLVSKSVVQFERPSRFGKPPPRGRLFFLRR